jgi:hypothetical protein
MIPQVDTPYDWAKITGAWNMFTSSRPYDFYDAGEVPRYNLLKSGTQLIVEFRGANESDSRYHVGLLDPITVGVHTIHLIPHSGIVDAGIEVDITAEFIAMPDDYWAYYPYKTEFSSRVYQTDSRYDISVYGGLEVLRDFVGATDPRYSIEKVGSLYSLYIYDDGTTKTFVSSVTVTSAKTYAFFIASHLGYTNTVVTFTPSPVAFADVDHIIDIYPINENYTNLLSEESMRNNPVDVDKFRVVYVTNTGDEPVTFGVYIENDHAYTMHSLGFNPNGINNVLAINGDDENIGFYSPSMGIPTKEAQLSATLENPGDFIGLFIRTQVQRNHFVTSYGYDLDKIVLTYA